MTATTPTSELRIRRATENDEPCMLELLCASLGVGVIPRTSEYWRWKHLENPFGESPVLLAEADSKIVGLRAFMRWNWQTGEQTISAVRAVDTATHPDYRGQGIFRRLTLQLREVVEREGAAFVFNTPNAQSRPGYLKMGWTSVGKPTMWVRPVRTVRFLKSILAKDIQGEEDEPPEVDAQPVGAVLQQAGVTEMVEAANSRRLRRLHTPINMPYLKWRYVDIPEIDYYGMVQGTGAEGAMLVVRTRWRGEFRELRICQIVACPNPSSRRNARQLLRRVRELADVDAVVAMSGGPMNCRRLLMAAGFLPVPRSGPILTVYPFGAAETLPELGKLSNWNAAIGDLELF